MNPIDLVHFNFNPQSLWALNAIIGLVMFAVALEIFKPATERESAQMINPDHHYLAMAGLSVFQHMRSLAVLSCMTKLKASSP